MPVSIIDENLPSSITTWNNERFIHVLAISEEFTDSDIWQYALENSLMIITKNADFYYRFLSSLVAPKIIWIKTGNIKKRDFYRFVSNVWNEVEAMLKLSSFVIIDEDQIEGLT